MYPSKSSGESIDPITGTTLKFKEGVAITDEVKEREAEKKFVLIDRLEKTGNPTLCDRLYSSEAIE